MKKIYQLVSLVGLLMLFISCANKDADDITYTLRTFYKSYRIGAEYRDSTLLSVELVQLLEQAFDKEGEEIKKILNGSSPTDKPLMIEADIFTSMYEGADSLDVKNVSINNHTATATVQFFNKSYQQQWIDTVMLVYEQQKWKIDNVKLHPSPSEYSSTKDILIDYLQTSE